MESVFKRFLVLSFLIGCYLTNRIAGLTCHCDDGTCKSGTCDAPKNLFTPGHCQLLYNPSINGDKAWRGCNLSSSNCDIVTESKAIDVTFSRGKLTSYSGCCSEDHCNMDESTLNLIKNDTCKALVSNDNSSAATSTDFSCHCDPNDMTTLFDLSVERGIQWFSSSVVGNAQVQSSNATNLFVNSTILRNRMAGFCTNNMCSPSTIAASGVLIPEGVFPVCSHFVRSDNGKAVRGCSFVPIANPPKDSVRRTQSTFPLNPVAGMYDVRVGVNASDRYNLIFECRSDMCNERQFVQGVLSQCLGGVQVPSTSQIAVEPSGAHGTAQVTTPSPEIENGTVVGVETTPSVQDNETLHHHHIENNETVIDNGSLNGTITDVPPVSVNGTESEPTPSVVVNGTEPEATVTPIPVDGTEPAATVEGTATPVPVDVNATVVHNDHPTPKPNGSAARQVLHLLYVAPVLALLVFK